MTEEVVVIAKYDYRAENSQELDIKKNEKLVLIDDSRDWWKVQNARNKSGFVPSNYVRRPKPSFFSSLKSTLGRKNRNEVKVSSPLVSRNGDTSSDQNSTSSDIQICDHMPAIAKFNYTAQQRDEMSLTKGEKVVVMEKSNDGWWKGRKPDSTVGWFPSNYVEKEENENSDSAVYSMAATLETQHMALSEIVTALYQFNSTNPEELSFVKGERLIIIDKPSEDPEWWRARNSRGETGLVPRNYVQPCEDSECDTATNTSSCTPQSQSTSSLSNTSNLSVVGLSSRKQFRVSGPLQEKEWYYGKITRQQCEDVLSKYAENGDFLIRDSESASGNFTVVLKSPERNKHFRVQVNNEGLYEIGQQKFPSLDELIEHYKKHPIYKHENDKLYLIRSFTCPSEF
ncbi:hypothetical protein ScPMuIL_018856 [Solemya velum]